MPAEATGLKRVRQLDFRLQDRNPAIGFLRGQVRLEQLRLVSLGAEGAQGGQLARGDRGVDLVGQAKILCRVRILNLKFVLILFSMGINPTRWCHGQQIERNSPENQILAH